MCVALSGLLIKGRVFVDGMSQSHEDILYSHFSQATVERHLLDDAIVEWECHPAGSRLEDYFDIPVDQWQITCRSMSKGYTINPEEYADEIFATTKRWRNKYIADIGNGTLYRKDAYLVRSHGGEIESCRVVKVVGSLNTISKSFVDVVSGTVLTLRNSIVDQYTGVAGCIYSTIVNDALDLTASSVAYSRIHARKAEIRRLLCSTLEAERRGRVVVTEYTHQSAVSGSVTVNEGRNE